MKNLLLLSIAIIIVSCETKKNDYIFIKSIVYKKANGLIEKDTLLNHINNNGFEVICIEAYSRFLLDSLKYYSEFKEVKTNDSMVSFNLEYQNGEKIDCSNRYTNEIRSELLAKAQSELKTIEYRFTDEYKEDIKKYREAKASEKISSTEFETYLSSWDGSFPPLKDYLKENLNDPSSFEHVQTGFITRNGWVEVKMIYRAKNSFGALVKEAIVAKASNDGKLLEIIQVIN